MARPELVVFDINHTLIEDNSWLNMNKALGMTDEEDKSLWDLNQSGVMDNDTWVTAMNAIYHERGKATLETIQAAVLDYAYIDGARKCVKELMDAGIQVALLSGAMNLVVEQVAKDLGVQIHRASSQLYFNPDGSFAKMTYLDEDVKAKVYDLVDISRVADVELENIVCVGDGANEGELFKLTRGVTFEGSDIADSAWRVVPSIKEVSEAILEG